MLGIPALLAGCGRIVLCSPPRASGTIDPIVAAAAHLIGIRDVYRIGGVQAIAAMAYGTASVPRVRKIFGPGNRFVAAAKVLVSSDPEGAAIDLIAGPSEVLVLADASADPASVAWDLVSQAEHDADAHAILVTADAPLAEQVTRLLPEILATAPRAEQLRASLSHSFALIVESLDEACSFANLYAPEHLVIMTNDAARCAGQINNAGSIFIGSFSPVTAGDYASGTNHTLPTGGTARWFSGVSVESFQKTVTFQSISRDGLNRLAPTLTTLAELEGLEGHSRAVRMRLESNRPKP
jgi:histidinol dehydrogenase